MVTLEAINNNNFKKDPSYLCFISEDKICNNCGCCECELTNEYFDLFEMQELIEDGLEV